jgi:hypothetical protein
LAPLEARPIPSRQLVSGFKVSILTARRGFVRPVCRQKFPPAGQLFACRPLAKTEEGCIGSARRDLRHPPCYRGHFQYNLLNETVGRAPPMGIQSQGGALHRTLGEGWGGIPSRSEASEA